MPIRPVGLLQRASASFSTWPASARTPNASSRHEPEHDAGVPEGEPEADRQRPLALGHQLAGGVVDGGDVVGVEGVPHAERVRGDARARRRRPGPSRPGSACGATTPTSTPQPTTCSAATNSAMPAIEAHSRRERAARARVLHAGRVGVAVLMQVPASGSWPARRGTTPLNVRRAAPCCNSFAIGAVRVGVPPRSQDREHAPVDVDDLAVDEAGGVRAQVDQGADEVLDPAPPAGGRALADPGRERPRRRPGRWSARSRSSRARSR